jgi:acyl-CoA synthetase (AMP-forming)/AMP-acid ligase II
VIQIDTLPRNVMGKVLKHELRAKLADGTLAPS